MPEMLLLFIMRVRNCVMGATPILNAFANIADPDEIVLVRTTCILYEQGKNYMYFI